MKKILFLLLGILCPLGIMAQDLTFGITRTIASEKSTSSDTENVCIGYAVSNEALVGDNASSYVTLAKAHSTKNKIMTDKARYIYHGNTKCYVDKDTENVRSSSTILGDNYYAFTLTVTEGHAITIKSISGDVCVDADKFEYEMSIEDETGTQVYRSNKKSIAKKDDDAKKTVQVSDLTDADVKAKLTNMTGKVTVKLYWTCTKNTGKYCIIKDYLGNLF